MAVIFKRLVSRTSYSDKMAAFIYISTAGHVRPKIAEAFPAGRGEAHGRAERA